MATVFEGDKLLAVKQINVATSGTHYTVPAGRFARVKIVSIDLTTTTLTIGNYSEVSISIDYPNFGALGSATTTLQHAVGFLNKEFILLPTETIATAGGTTGELIATILEYEDPT